MSAKRCARRACGLAMFVVLAFASLPARAGAQGQVATKPGLPEAPARKPPPPPTAIVRGRVTASGTQTGVRHARVMLNQGQRAVTTDNEGRYEFRQLAAGRYTVSVTKAPFLTVEYAQRGPREPGRPLDLGDGQVADHIDIVLPRACVLAGTVFDELGEPAEQVRVAAMRVQRAAGGPRLVVAGTPVRTNDLGQYRIYGLPPGKYYIGTPAPIADSLPRPVADRAYRPTYYPGTSNVSEALPIALDVGQQRLDADFSLVAGRPSRVSGRVVNRGRAVGGWSIQATQPLSDSGGLFTAATAAIRSDGSFTIGQLGAGDYALLVTGKDPGTGMELAASYPLVVGDADIEDVVLAMAPTLSVSGYVTLQRASPAASGASFARPADLATIRVWPEPTADSPPSPSATSTMNASGRFEIRNLVPGRVRFRVTGLPDGWLLDSITDMGREITDTPVELRGISLLSVVLTDRAAELGGSVTDAADRVPTDYVVIVFPENRSLWDSQRLLAAARPDQNGRYAVRGLPRGSYYAVAVERVMADDPFDADYLERLRREATRVTLLKGESKTVDLQLARQ
ncbi:MAG: MSCRAMM family protein [Bacteroidales bacterium]